MSNRRCVVREWTVICLENSGEVKILLLDIFNVEIKN